MKEIISVALSVQAVSIILKSARAAQLLREKPSGLSIPVG